MSRLTKQTQPTLFDVAVAIVMSDADQYQIGIEDCKAGRQALQDNQSYLNGYGYQYELEEKRTGITIDQEGNHV